MTANLARSLQFPDIVESPIQPTPKKSTGMLSAGHVSDRKEPGLEKACAELESLFIHQLLKQMRAAVPKSDLMGGGQAEELYTSMLDGEMAKELAARGGIGLAVLLKDQLLERTSAFPGPAASPNFEADIKKLKQTRPLADNQFRSRRS